MKLCMRTCETCNKPFPDHSDEERTAEWNTLDAEPARFCSLKCIEAADED